MLDDQGRQIPRCFPTGALDEAIEEAREYLTGSRRQKGESSELPRG
jgi:hypothetical protein